MDYEKVLQLMENKQYTALKNELIHGQIPDVAEFIDELDAKEKLLVFRMLPKEMAVGTFAYLSPESQSALTLMIQDVELQEIFEDLFFDDKIDFLEEMPANVVKKILANTSENERKLINQFLNYPEDSAGSLMTIEYVDLKKHLSVQEALDKIRRSAPDQETIYTCYVTDQNRRLEGTVSLKALVLSDPQTTIESIMNTSIVSATTLQDKEDTAAVMMKYDLLSIPVTDNDNRLIGIITIDDIVDVIEEENTEDFHKMATVGKLEGGLLETRPLLLIRKRLPWLLVLVLMNVFSGAGIAHFEETIQSAIALVFFLPLLIDSAGNAGAQSSTLMIRALATGDVESSDWFSLFKKEILVAIFLGLVMAMAVSVLGLLRGGPQVAVVVALSMVIVVLVGSTIGMSLPFLLNRLKLDPATASGPLVTSIADITGVLIYFSIATWYLGF